MARIAINGLGRVGRTFLRLALEHPALDVVAANDIADSGFGRRFSTRCTGILQRSRSWIVPFGATTCAAAAAATNIVPATTGAAVAVARAIPELRGKFDGVAMRVPVLTGSLSSIVFLAGRETSVEEINQALQDAARDSRWSGVLATTSDLLVSSDIVGDPHAAVVDLSLTKVIDGNLCAVYSWYDNEFGFANTLLAHVVECATVRAITV